MTDQFIKTPWDMRTTNFCKQILAINTSLGNSLLQSEFSLFYGTTSQRSHFEHRVSNHLPLSSGFPPWLSPRYSVITRLASGCSHGAEWLLNVTTERKESILTLCSSTGVGDMISFISCFIFRRVTDFLPTSEGRVLLRVVWL